MAEIEDDPYWDDEDDDRPLCFRCGGEGEVTWDKLPTPTDEPEGESDD